MTVMKKEPESTKPLRWAILAVLAVTVAAFVYQIV